MKWEKRGLVFAPSGQYDWMRSHAANPVAEHLQGDYFRIYFGCRDAANRTSIAFVDVELADRPRVAGLAERPVIGPGELGGFDDSGSSLGCLVSDGERQLLYYVGWNLGVTVPWRNSIGLATRSSGAADFVRFSPAPILDRSPVDPYTLSYPWVLRDEGRWRMWYGSNLRWGREHHDMDHVIKYAESADGIHWERNGVIALGLGGPEEYALCRPCVQRDGDLYRMWYCYRGAAYRLGYAESADGIRWQRRHDQVGIDVSASGWDAEMLAYPFVFRHRGSYHLLYNGNRYGQTGFGWAVAAATAAAA
jgi:hypothetical protein